MAQGINQCTTALWVGQQVILQVGIALHHPHIAEYFVEHAGRAPRAPLLTQLIQNSPRVSTEQPHHDLLIRKRCVVVGYFAQTRHLGVGQAKQSVWDSGVHGGVGGSVADRFVTALYYRHPGIDLPL